MITGGAPEQTLKIVMIFLCFGRCILDKGLVEQTTILKIHKRISVG
jgi:hypothetical protein